MSGTIPNQFKMNNGKELVEEDGDVDDDEDDCSSTASKRTTTIRRHDDEPNVDNDEDQLVDESSSRTSLMSKSGTCINSAATSVQVALRIRPLLPREVISNARECIKVAENDPQVWIAQSHAFTYDHVFNTDVEQDHIFSTVAKPLVDGILEGYNATILAYGQTGSGKTYTMGTGFDPNVLVLNTSNSNPTQGLLPRCISYLFTQITSTTTPTSSYDISVQFTELYNEEVIDLLLPSRPSSARNPVKIHEQANGEIYLVNITTKPVHTAADTLETLKSGALNRTTASTNMNDSSSRSHAIFTINVTQNRVIQSKQTGQDLETLHGKFHFVDLAGSERLKRTLATGDRAREGIAINSGLLALGNVISALGDRSKKALHVPYRDSKLTRLLQDSLGGNSRTLMIACVSPNELDFVETLNTMKYANRAKNIKNKVVVNQDKSSRTIGLLREEIAMLKNELMEVKRRAGSSDYANEFGGDVSAENIMLLTEVETLRSKVKSKQEMIDKLTGQVARLQAVSIIGNSDGIECDLTSMVAKYLLEIEELRARLYESESECEKLRTKQRVIIKNLSSPGRASTGRESGATEDVSELLKSARSEVEMEKKKVDERARQESCDEEDDEEDDSENEESDPNEQNYTELANLTQEINTKQRLIEELENSQLRLESIKHKYEEKLSTLSAKIKSTEDERDAFMAKLPSTGTRTRPGTARDINIDKKMEYESKIQNLQQELKKWALAKKHHAKMIKDQSAYETQIRKLKNEVDEMKRVKVKLMNQVKNENLRFREVEKMRVKEITQLKKESRVKEIRVKKLESEGVRKEAVLKRKIQEVEMLKKKHAAGLKSGSPVKGKQVWGRIHANLVKDVNARCNVVSLEREMVELITRRGELRSELEYVDGEEADSLRENLRFVEGKIRGVQDGIVCCEMVGVEGVICSKRPYGRNAFGEVDYAYVVEKLYEQSVSGLSEVGLLEGRVRVTEEANKQLQLEVETLRDLLHHLYYSRGSGQGIDEIRPPSSLSNNSSTLQDSRFMLPPPPPPPPPQVQGQPRDPPAAAPTVTKARRRLTATTQELLGSAESVSSLDSNYVESLLLGNKSGFVRNTRLTQSLRGSNRNNNNRVVGQQPPPFVRQDTYCVDEEEGGRNKQSDDNIMNRTYLLSDDTGSITNTNTEGTTTTSPTKVTSTTTTPTESLADQTNPFAVTNSGSNSTNNAPKMMLQRSVSEIEGGGDRGGYFSRGRSGLLGESNSSSRIGIGGSANKAPRSNAWLQLQGTLEGHTKQILCLQSTNSKLVSGSKDGSCRVWDLETRSELNCFDGHPHNVSCVAFLEESSLVLTGSSYQLRVWDLRCRDVVKVMGSSGTTLDPSTLSSYQPPPIPSLPTSTPLPRVNELPPGEKQITFIQPVRNYFFTSMGDRIKIWDLRKQSSIGLLAGKHNSTVMCSTGCSSGVRGNDWVITGSKDHSIKVYEFEAGTPAEGISRTKNLSPVHYDGVECLYLGGGESPFLFSGSRDTCIKKWDLESYKMVSTVTGAHGGWVTGIAGVPSGASSAGEFIVSCSRDGYLKMWDCGGKEFKEVCRFDGGGGSIECVESNARSLFFSNGMMGGGGGGGNNNSVISLYQLNDKIFNLILHYREKRASSDITHSPDLMTTSMTASLIHIRSHSSSSSRLATISPSSSPKLLRRKFITPGPSSPQLTRSPHQRHQQHHHHAYLHSNNNTRFGGSSDDIMSRSTGGVDFLEF